MRILVSGSTGLVGQALLEKLSSTEHVVSKLVRKTSSASDEITWSVKNQTIESSKCEGIDAVVHLAGENIVGRWNAEKKKRIRESRIEGTQLLCKTLSALESKPKVLVCASAIGYYGDQGNTECFEDSPVGKDFLAEVCQAWEKETEVATYAGIRVVNLRIGVVLASNGGALQKMLPPFRVGLGGPLGNGKMYWSWVSIEDVVGAVLHCIETDSLSGPVNATAPEPITNAVFTKALANTLKRPAFLPVPQFGARLLMGEMADALLFASTKAVPKKLIDSGYAFKYPRIQEALQAYLT